MSRALTDSRPAVAAAGPGAGAAGAGHSRSRPGSGCASGTRAGRSRPSGRHRSRTGDDGGTRARAALCTGARARRRTDTGRRRAPRPRAGLLTESAAIAGECRSPPPSFGAWSCVRCAAPPAAAASRRLRFDDRGEARVASRGAHQLLEALELLAQLGAGRELHLVPACRDRLDACRPRRLTTATRGLLQTGPPQIRLTGGRDDNSVRTEFDASHGLRHHTVRTQLPSGSGRARIGWPPARFGPSNERFAGPHKAGSGQTADPVRHVRPWRELGDKLLDPPLREMRGPRQERRPVLERQVRRELDHAAEVQAAVREHREKDGVLARRARRGDAQVGFRLGEVEHLGAVGEQRRRRRAHVEAPLVHLGEVRDDVGLVSSRLAQQIRELAQELVVREQVQRPIRSPWLEYRQRLPDRPGSRTGRATTLGRRVRTPVPLALQCEATARSPCHSRAGPSDRASALAESVKGTRKKQELARRPVRGPPPVRSAMPAGEARCRGFHSVDATAGARGGIDGLVRRPTTGARGARSRGSSRAAAASAPAVARCGHTSGHVLPALV